MQKMKTFVINLDFDHQRFSDLMKTDMLRECLDIERISAVKGSSLPATAAKMLTQNDWAHENKGTLGCFLSHVHAWEFCSRQDRPSLVIEDDVDVSNLNLLHELTFPENLDVLFCNDRTLDLNQPAVFTGINFSYRNLNDCYSNIVRNGRGVGADGYILTPTGAKKLCDFIQRDGFFSHVDTRMLVYSLNPEKHWRLYTSVTQLPKHD